MWDNLVISGGEKRKLMELLVGFLTFGHKDHVAISSIPTKFIVSDIRCVALAGLNYLFPLPRVTFAVLKPEKRTTWMICSFFQYVLQTNYKKYELLGYTGGFFP